MIYKKIKRSVIIGLITLGGSGAFAGDDLLFSASYKNGVKPEIAKSGGSSRYGRGGVVKGEGLNAAAEGFRPYVYQQAGNITDAAGTVEFSYKPQLPDFSSSKKGTMFSTMFYAAAGGPHYNGLKIGLNLKPGNKKYVWVIIKSPDKSVKSTQIYRLAELKNNQWYKFVVCWNQEHVKFFINGKLIGTVDRPEKIIGGTALKIGGVHEKDFAHGLIADLKIYNKIIAKYINNMTQNGAKSFNPEYNVPPAFADCLKLEFPNKKGKVILRTNRVHKISAEQFGIVVDSRVPVTLKLSSDKFKIIPNATYAVNFSDRPPQYLQASSNGILSIALTKPRNFCNIVISKVDGTDLLKNVTWHGRIDSVTKPTMGWGHEGVAENAEIGRAKTACGKFKRDTSISKTGKASFYLEKLVRDGEVSWKSSPIKLTPGKEYLLSGWYHITEPKYGAVALFRARLDGAGKKTKLCRAIFTNPLVAPLHGAQWRYIQTKIKVPAGYDRATVVLALRGAEQQIWWNNLALREAPKPLYAVDKAISPKDRKAKYSLTEIRAIWNKHVPREIKIINNSGLPSLLVNGKPLPLLAYNHYVVRSSDCETKRTIASGINWQFVRVTHYLKEWWQGKDKYDFKGLREEIETVLRYNPEAVIMLNIKITPAYRNWGFEYPDAVWRDHDGRKIAGYKSGVHKPKDNELGHGRRDLWAASYSAEDYRKSVAEALKALATHLHSFQTGKAVAGAVFWSGTDNQWFPHVKYKGFDFSTGAQKDFQQYLREIYKNNVKLLRQAWGKSEVTFNSAKLAPFMIRTLTGRFFLDPKQGQDRWIIDSNRYNDVGVMKSINYFGRTFKSAMQRNVFTMVYAPDIMQGYSGRSARKVIMDDDAIDGIVSVPDYGFWRMPGRSGNYASATGSLTLHNKIFLSELDYRTNMSNLSYDAFYRMRDVMGGSRDEHEFVNQARRDLGMLAAQGAGAWFLVMNRNTFNTPEYLPVLKEVAQAMKLAANRPMPQDRGQICLFSDEDTRNIASYTYGMGLNNLSIGMARLTMNRSGVSWDPYYLSDLTNSKRHKYKVYMFLAAPTISAEQIKWVKQNLQKDGNVLVFVNAAGISSDKGLFEQNIFDLTGMKIKYDLSSVKVFRIAPVSGDRLAAKVKDNIMTEAKQPLFYVDDPSATTFGKISDTGKTGWAVKRFQNWTSIYISLPGNFTPQLVRNIIREADMKPIGPVNDVTYSGNGFITIHALFNGTKMLQWDKKCDLLDLSTGKIIGKNINSIKFDMLAGETRWFRKQ
jgi:Concanavalin A-like lectin/glucanases superfamily